MAPLPDGMIFSNYGDNWLKFRVRSHPDVTAIRHPIWWAGSTDA